MLNYIGIAVTEINKREFIKELLRFIDIRPSKDSRLGEIILHGYFNFKIAKDFNLVDLHPDKKRKFHNAYTKLIESNPDALTKFKIIEVLKKEPMTRFKIAEELNADISKIHKALRDLEMKAIVNRCGKKGLKIRWGLSKVPKDLYVLMKRDYS